MTPKNKIFRRIGALCLVLAMCLSFAACREQEEESTGTPDTTGSSTIVPGKETNFTLEVKTQGGAPLKDISIYVYEDGSLQNLIAVGTTDADGKMMFTYQGGTTYVAVLGGVPAGYGVESSYPITNEMTQIVLSAQMVEGDLNTAKYKLGDMMQDFTFTAADGAEYKLSDLLDGKRTVVLNFWKLDHNPCKMELPFWQEAYTEYADRAMVLGMNPIDSDNAEIAAFAQEQGLTFPVGSCDPKWENAMNVFGYPTTVVIDRFGMITLVNGAAFATATEVKDVLKFFTADEYAQTVVEDYKTILTSEPEAGSDNPVDISGINSFQLTIAPGKVHFLNIHKMQNVWLQVNNSDIYVEYGGKKFTASGGSVGLLVSAPSTFEPAQLGFGNSGEETQTFTVTLSNLAGSYENPYEMKVGEFTTSVNAGNNQGVYFKYTAAEDGYFTIQCVGVTPSGVKYGVSAMNLTTSAMRNTEDDGQVDPNTGNRVVTMGMNKGEQLRIIISTMPDDSNNYPAATFKMLAGFTAGDVEDVVVVEKIAYAVTVTDENRNPIPGVNVNLVGTVPEATEPENTEPVEPESTDPNATEPVVTEPEPNRATLVTDENGVAAGYLPEDIYTGSVVIPAGYKIKDTGFELSPESPFASVKLDTHIVIMEDYTVRVIDEAGNPVPGTLITIGSTFGTTNEDGVYTVSLEKGAYTAVIGAPEGYYAENISVPFPAGGNTLGITLKEGTGEQEGIRYTVSVVDANGMGLTDILVTFNQYGSPVSVVPVDSTGTATANLMPGEYTVSLTSAAGNALKFDASQASLNEEKTSTTIMVAADISGSNHDSAYWGSYYRITTGSAWVNLTKIINYSEEFGAYMYVFNPGETGIYRFSVSSGVTLGYYGGISFPNGPSMTTDNENGYFEITIKEGEFANENQPSYVLGLIVPVGTREATMTVVRTGDAPAELPRIVYEPTCEITPFTAGNGKITYVNLTRAAAVERGADGFYYLNGKKLYINLSNAAPHLTFGSMLGINYDTVTGQWVTSSMGTGMKGLIYDGDTVIAVEDFTDCMSNYVRASDPITGVYPLNDDLIYMIKSCGSYMGWWNADSPNYLFESVTNLYVDSAWLFAVCTIG